MVSTMRTTLILDDDLASLLKQRPRALGVPFNEAVNRTIRAGLDETACGSAVARAENHSAFVWISAGRRRRQARAVRRRAGG
jgi:hypothetical protein